MLQVVNLTKIYKSKKGAEVRALDGVSLDFASTGMVFLLGKSGSGKSTLLNLCGGLDSPTDGEIIVKGRSSKKFSKSDFDSYRNTFIGFIFQEYNILNEFSVEDNIALALELQGKPKRRKDIDALLEEVDLKGYGRRKPNTLSGGQKQRIAIARALVKSPEIIMADEPTGALDSNTGRQVLETLKKLSRDKLVIVVSHDRDFAEKYGDRIIELQDGKVISDVTKTQMTGQQVTENVSEIDNVLSIKKGAELTEADFEKIKTFLSDSESDVVIAKNEKDVRNFKKVSRINDDGEKEVFRDTDPNDAEKKEYTEKDSKFIRSKLPLRHAVKIGVSGLGRKPFRLFLTILLCTVAFILFGLLSTLSFYDNEATFKETLPNSDISILSLNKTYMTHETYYQNGEKLFEYDSVMNTPFAKADVDSLKSSFGNDIFGGVSVYASYNLRAGGSNYWQSDITTFAYLPDGNLLRGEDNLIGKYPENENEIAISSYAAQMLYECKTFDKSGKEISLASPEDIIGKVITIEGYDFTVVGIVKSGDIPSKYDYLKTSEDVSYNLINEYSAYLADGLHLMAFVSEDRMEELFRMNSYKYSGFSSDVESRTGTVLMYVEGVELDFIQGYNVKYLGYSSWTNKKDVIYLDPQKTALGDNGVLIPDKTFYELVFNAVGAKIDEIVSGGASVEGTPYLELSDLSYALISGQRIVTDENGDHVLSDKGEVTYEKISPEEKALLQKRLIELVGETDIGESIRFQMTKPSDRSLFGDVKSYNVVGIYEDENAAYDSAFIVLDDSVSGGLWDEQKQYVDFYTEYSSQYAVPADAMYENIYVPYSGDRRATDFLWEIYSSEEFGADGSRINLGGSFVNELMLVDEMVQLLSNVFLYVGIVLAVFAALLFSNFISTSISYKKREIGILRAVGARSFDVFKIFFSESAVISIICVALSTVGSVAICAWLNVQLASSIGVSLFVFGPMSFIVLVAIAVVTAFVATFLPVYNAARKKPVDSIRAI